MRESEIEDYLIKRVKELGGEVRKLKWIGRVGAPDRFVGVFGKNFIIELKATGKKPRAYQWREILFLRDCGMVVWVADSIAAIDEILSITNEWLDIKRANWSPYLLSLQDPKK